MQAGIDSGSTLLKAYWQTTSAERFITIERTASKIEALESLLRKDGVRRIRVTGTGASDLIFEGIMTVAAPAGIDDEIALQAAGTRWLLGLDEQAPSSMIIASLGTGVSYTTVSWLGIKRSPLGSAHGGLTMMGLVGLLGIRDFAELEALAAKGTAPDRLVKHVLPATDGTPTGELIMGHFADPDASLADKCAGIFSLSAASVFKDLAILRSIPLAPKDIVLVGTVARSEVYRSHLRKFESYLKKGTRLRFLARGEYAAAIGAWRAVA